MTYVQQSMSIGGGCSKMYEFVGSIMYEISQVIYEFSNQVVW